MRKIFLITTLALAMAALALAGNGQNVYNQFCSGCHMANGQGNPGAFPPVANSIGSFVKAKEGRALLVHIVAFGIQGQLKSHGKTYSGFMPPFAQLSNAQVADLYNFILNEWNKKLLPKDFKPFTADEVAKYRAKAMTAADVLKERNALAPKVGVQ